MKGSAAISAELDAKGRTRLTNCGGTPPLTPRMTGPNTVHLVATAGGPIPGDRAELTIEVGPGAVLAVRATAATVASASPREIAGTTEASCWQIRARVAEGATLVVIGEPLVAAHGCDHVTTAAVTLLGDARLVWRDLLVPGRTAEESGNASVTLRVTRDGMPVLAQTLAVGSRAPGWAGTAVSGGARCVGSLLLAGPPPWRPAATQRQGGQAALTPLVAPGAALATALGDAPDVIRLLDAWLPTGLDAEFGRP